MYKERGIFEKTLDEEIQRLVGFHLTRKAAPELRRELSRIIEITLRIPPDSVTTLNAATNLYVVGSAEENALLNALETFLEEVPSEVEAFLTEQRNGTGSLMSRLRSKAEERRRFVNSQQRWR